MTKPTTQGFSLIGLIVAIAATLGVQGSLLMGFDRIARAADAPAAQVTSAARLVTLERVVVSALSRS